MKSIKVSEATPLQLNWLVAKCENYTNSIRINRFKEWEDLGRTQLQDNEYTLWSPLTDWSQGGPIIDREWDTLMRLLQAKNSHHGDMWTEYMLNSQSVLVVFMRCLVVSKIGDTAEVPDEMTS